VNANFINPFSNSLSGQAGLYHALREISLLGDGVLKRAEDNGPEKWRQSMRNTLKKPLRDLSTSTVTKYENTSQLKPGHNRSAKDGGSFAIFSLLIDGGGAGKRLFTGIFDSVHMARLISFRYRYFSIRAFMLR